MTGNCTSSGEMSLMTAMRSSGGSSTRPGLSTSPGSSTASTRRSPGGKTEVKLEVRIDTLGRADLSRVRKQDHVRYLAEEAADGTITLVPLVRVPAALPAFPLTDEEVTGR